MTDEKKVTAAGGTIGPIVDVVFYDPSATGPKQFVTFDLEMEGEPGQFWHIYDIDQDDHDVLRGDSLAITIDGPDTPEMYAAIKKVTDALDELLTLAERYKMAPK